MRGFTFTGVHHHAQVILLAELTLVAQSCLGLLRRLTGIVLIAAWRLTRVIPPFIVGQAAGVIGFDIHAVKQQGQLTDVIDAHAQFGVRQVFAGAAVIAVAVSGKAVGRYGVIDVPGMRSVADGAGRLQAIVPGAEAAVIAAGFDGWRLAAGLGRHIDHPAGGVAVQRRERTAQDIEAIDAADINIRGLALAIGHGGRNAVDVNAQPAHAVGGTGTKAANR